MPWFPEAAEAQWDASNRCHGNSDAQINTLLTDMYKYTRKRTSQENSEQEKIKASHINYMNSKKKEYFHDFLIPYIYT